MEDEEFYYDWYKHENNIFTTRGSFFLIGESMLLTAIAVLLASNKFMLNKYISVCLATGLFITIIWLWVNVTQIFYTQRPIKKKLRSIDYRYKKIVEKKPVSNHIVMGIVLPAGLCIVWIIILSIYASQ